MKPQSNQLNDLQDNLIDLLSKYYLYYCSDFFRYLFNSRHWIWYPFPCLHTSASHNFDKSLSLLLHSMLSSMYVEQRTVSAASGSSCLFFFGMLLTNCEWNGEELIPNTTLVNSNSVSSKICFKDLHSILWYGRCIRRIAILRYISTRSHVLDILCWYNLPWFCNIIHQVWVALPISILHSPIF